MNEKRWGFRPASEMSRPLNEGPVLFLVARGGPIREANQDSDAARRVRIGLSRSESIEPCIENRCSNQLVLRTSVRDTRIFSE